MSHPVPREVLLSPREWDIFTELCRDGASNAEIGRRLYISEDTVKTHMRHIFRKMDVHDRTHAVVRLLRREVTIRRLANDAAGSSRPRVRGMYRPPHAF